MPKSRLKAEKLPAAQSRTEAIDLLQHYAFLDAQIAARNARVEAAIAQMRAECDKLNAPQEAEQKAIFLRLKPWWAVAADDITGGKRKSVELGGCVIGHRINTPSLGYPKPETHAVALLQTAGWNGMLRIKVELDKPALMAAIRMLATIEAEPGSEAATAAGLLKGWGFSIVQKEEFFVDRLPPRDDATAVVTDPQAQQVAA